MTNYTLTFPTYTTGTATNQMSTVYSLGNMPYYSVTPAYTPPPAAEDEFAWLRRRVREITG